MAFQHGVRVQERATSIVAPITGTAGLQVVFGTAPVNLAADPYGVTNKPVLANSWAEAVNQLGYSAEKGKDGHYLYTLCASMYASFQLFNVAPVVFVNVLDPKKHRKDNPTANVAVANGEAVVPVTGILPDTVKVQASGAGVDGAAIDPATASVCPLDQGWKNKRYADLVGKSAKVLADGSVVGPLAYVEWPEYGQAEADQKGYYFPLHLGDTYKDKKIKTKRTSGEGGEEKTHENETDFVVHLTDGKDTVITFTEDEQEAPFLTLSFAGATLLKEGAKLDLEEGTDYILAFDDDGQLLVTMTGTDAPAYVAVDSASIDPTAVDKDDIIGATSGADVSGMEVLQQVYPKFGMTPGLLLAPGWSHIPDVGIVLAAKCQEINGYFSCEGFVDIDSTASGCTVYSDVKQYKESAGCNNAHIMALWPCVVSGSIKFWYSAVMAALTAYTDASNDDVPNLSPSNKLVSVTGTVLADAQYTENADGTGGTWDKEVLLDQLQANVVNSYGVTTAFNNNGWRTWGNRTAIYPANTDPKDMWFCVRRFFSWWGNSFMLTYAQKVDNPANRRLIESIVDAENIRGNAYVAQDKCAAARIEFLAEENAVTDLINGKLTFHQHLAPYVPAEDILNTLEFDPDALRSALIGG